MGNGLVFVPDSAHKWLRPFGSLNSKFLLLLFIPPLISTWEAPTIILRWE